MKRQNSSSELVTKKDLKQELGKFATKADLKNETISLRMNLDKLKLEIDDKARQYRDQVLTKLDGVMGELQNIREDNIIGSHQTAEMRDQVENHEKRIQKLEQTQQI